MGKNGEGCLEGFPRSCGKPMLKKGVSGNGQLKGKNWNRLMAEYDHSFFLRVSSFLEISISLK